jgi:hypothetical protein
MWEVEEHCKQSNQNMAKKHGAKEQKRIAKQKAKRAEKRSSLSRRTSTDPMVRLQRAEKWPVVRALASGALWEEGIGYMAIARQESEGRLVFAVYLVDVLCLGVKNALWRAGTPGDFEDLIREVERTQKMRPISPACLVKVVSGAVAFAQSFGFAPHADYRHAAMLLEGIDPATCPQEFTFGRDGRPFYMQGPYETPAEIMAILDRIQLAGGNYSLVTSVRGVKELTGIERGFDELEWDDEDDAADEAR